MGAEAARPRRPSVATRRVAARLAFATLFTLLALSGSALGVMLLGRSLYRFTGFEIECRLMPTARGQTRLVLTPLGEVYANTHNTPVSFIASLHSIRIEEIQALIKRTPKQEEIARKFEGEARSSLRNFFGRQIAMAGLGALLAPLLLSTRQWRGYLAGGFIGVGALGLALASAYTTFNPAAFESPGYTGTLKQAPWVMQFGRDAFTKIEALSQKLVTVANNLNVLYGRIAAMPDRLSGADGYDAFRVLHISDIHNNLAALDFVREVAAQFQVEFIVDTGDLTDFGSPPETVLVSSIMKLPFPYVFVPGNHDSRTVIEALAKAPNVTVLNGQPVNVKGLTLLGLPNPASARAGVGSVDTTEEERLANGNRLLQIVSGMASPPDIVAVHDPKESPPLWGRVPLILCGHMHRAYLERQSGSAPEAPPAASAEAALSAPTPGTTLLCNAGTTGAAGLRYFEKEGGVPFTCAVLTFDRATVPDAASQSADAALAPAGASSPAKRPTLRAIDIITLNGSLGEYSISRHTFLAPSRP